MLNPQPGARLEVWGDPVAHSRSPQLQSAAYRVLGLDWTYERRRVSDDAFAETLRGLPPAWRGLSLTMPLKGAAFAAARTHDRRAELTGAVNTLLLTADGPHGCNTDVGGIVRDLTEHGIHDVSEARIVGAGATAGSVLVALGELGARRVEVVARRPRAVAPLAALGEALGVDVAAAPLTADATAPAYDPMPLTIATLPGDAQVSDAATTALAASGGLLYDVVYGHWPTALATAWQRSGGRAVPGHGMLLHQALLQVRIFAMGDVDAPLPDEDAVLAAMRDALMGD